MISNPAKNFTLRDACIICYNDMLIFKAHGIKRRGSKGDLRPFPPSFGRSRQFSYLYIKVSYHGVALPHLYTHTWFRFPMTYGTFFFACQDFLMSCNKDTFCHIHLTPPQSLPPPTLKNGATCAILSFFLDGDNLTLPQEANMYIIKKSPKA